MTLWLNRVGKHGEHESKFLDDDRIYLTWGELKHDLAKITSKPALKDFLQKRRPDTTAKSIGWSMGQIWNFSHEMKPGDWVAVPSKKEDRKKNVIHIAEIIGPYVFDPDAEDPYYHYRAVKWIEKDIPWSDLLPEVRKALGLQFATCKVHDQDAEKCVRAMATEGWKSAGGLPPPKVKDELDDSPHSNPGGGLVEWENIAEAAACIFNVWSEQQPELEWAKTAWQHLREHGLTRYSTDVDWHVVQCRLLALGGIYRDFCQLAWDAAETDYESMAEGMKLDEFTLGRLYQCLDNGSTNDDVGMDDAMESIVEAQRPAVVAAIQEGFGDEEDLIRSLWNCCMMGDFDSDDDGDEIVPETGMSMSKLRALDWILGGCVPLG